MNKFTSVLCGLFLGFFLYGIFATSLADQLNPKQSWGKLDKDMWSKELSPTTTLILMIEKAERGHDDVIYIMQMMKCPDGKTQGLQWIYDDKKGVLLHCGWKKSESVTISEDLEKLLKPLPKEIEQIIQKRKLAVLNQTMT